MFVFYMAFRVRVRRVESNKGQVLQIGSLGDIEMEAVGNMSQNREPFLGPTCSGLELFLNEQLYHPMS